MSTEPIQLSDETSLDQVDLPPRLRNAFASEGIKTVGEVRDLADADLRSLQNLGAASVRHVRRLFGPSRQRGKPLGGSEPL